MTRDSYLWTKDSFNASISSVDNGILVADTNRLSVIHDGRGTIFWTGVAVVVWCADRAKRSPTQSLKKASIDLFCSLFSTAEIQVNSIPIESLF